MGFFKGKHQISSKRNKKQESFEVVDKQVFTSIHDNVGFNGKVKVKIIKHGIYN